MSSKSKRQGTLYEFDKRSQLAQDLQMPIARFAEEGIYDRGDLGFHLAGLEFVVECRDREAMPVHTASLKAKVKAGTAISFITWKRKVKTASGVRRQIAPEVVIVPLSDMRRVLARLRQLEGREQS